MRFDIFFVVRNQIRKHFAFHFVVYKCIYIVMNGHTDHIERDATCRSA